MAKLSIGLRGWRFEESDVFTPDGEYRPLPEMPADTRIRLQRLAALVGSPCHACWLIHGDEQLGECNVARVVYGEPNAEIVTCDDHEPDFLYWYRECGGAAHRGEESLQDGFHDWFESGGRAPDEYGSDEHVDTAPDALPDPPVEQASCDVVLGDDVVADAVATDAAPGGTRDATEPTGDDAPAENGADAPEGADADPADEDDPSAPGPDIRREYPT